MINLPVKCHLQKDAKRYKKKEHSAVISQVQQGVKIRSSSPPASYSSTPRNVICGRPGHTEQWPCRNGFQVNISGKWFDHIFSFVYPDQTALPYGKHDDGNPQLLEGRATTTNGGFVGVSGSSPRTAQLPPLVLRKRQQNTGEWVTCEESDLVSEWLTSKISWWINRDKSNGRETER